MSEEDQIPTSPQHAPAPERREKRISLIVLALVLILLSAVFVLSRVRSGRTPASQRNDATASLVMGDMQVKLSYFYGSLGDRAHAVSAMRAAIATYDSSIRQSPTPSALRRSVALQCLTRPEEASATAGKMLSKDVVEGQPDAAKAKLKSEVAMWKRICSPEPLSPQQADTYAARLRALDVGPPRYVALQALYLHANEQARAKQQEKNARRMFTTDVGAAGVLLALVILGGAAGTITLLILVLFPGVTNRLLQLGNRHEAESELSPALWLSFSATIFIILAGSFLVAGVLALLPQGLRNNASSVRVVATVIPSLIALLVIKKILRDAGATFRTIGLRSSNVITDIAWGIAGYATCLPLLGLATLIYSLVSRLIPNVTTPTNPALTMLLSSRSTLALVLVFLLAAVAAPFFEEIFFRGVLFRAARSRFGVWPGIITSAVVFAMIHPQLPAGFAPIFVLGFVFAVLVQARDSLLPAMIAHGINNGGLFLMVYFATRS